MSPGLSAPGWPPAVTRWISSAGRRVVSRSSWQQCTLFPFHRGGFDTNLLRDYLRGLRPDVLVTLHDISLLTDVFDPAHYEL